MFMCEFTQIDTTDAATWSATTSGSTKTLVEPYTNYKLIGFMVVESGGDGVSHREIQWLPSRWLYNEMASNPSPANRRIVFNYTRSDTDRRAWVYTVQGSNTKLTFRKTTTAPENYLLYIWGLK